MQVDIKKELNSLDRNDFDRVAIFVSKIIEDIKDATKIDEDMGLSLVEDYLFDLINPDLLDFDSE